MSELTLRIDWSDLDLFGHVNNVAFFKYMQAGRLNCCEGIGLTSLNEEGKLSFMVANSTCAFKKTLLYPGDIKVISKVGWIKNSSFQIDHLLYNQAGELCAEGSDILVLFDYKLQQKVTMSEDMRQLIEKKKS